MKITIKTLQQKLFTVDVEPEDTVQAIKSKINEEQGHPVESQKLIYSGKVLDDSKVVKDCNFKEKDFLVLMVSKAKAATTTPAASTSAASTSAPVTTSVAPATPAPVERPAAVEPTPINATPVNPVPVETAPINPAPVNPNPVTATDTTDPNPATTETTATTTTAPTTAPATTPATIPSDPDFVTGSALESTISNMMEMGFTRDQCTRALRASFNNPERAVEYLFNGIPPGLLAETAPRTPATTAPTTAGGGGMPSTTTPSTAIPAGGVATNRQTAGTGTQNLFQMAQQQQQQRGAGLGGAGAGLGAGGLGGLGGSRGLGGLGGLGGAGAGAGAGAAGLGAAGGPGAPTPESLAQVREAIAQNPALLQQAIQAILQENPALAQQINQNPELLYQMFAGGEEGDDEGGYAPPMGMQPQTIALTQDEMAAIQRLQALGFTQQQAAEAYLACGKNEELAANFLFEGGFGDD